MLEGSAIIKISMPHLDISFRVLAILALYSDCLNGSWFAGMIFIRIFGGDKFIYKFCCCHYLLLEYDLSTLAINTECSALHPCMEEGVALTVGLFTDESYWIFFSWTNERLMTCYFLALSNEVNGPEIKILFKKSNYCVKFIKAIRDSLFEERHVLHLDTQWGANSKYIFMSPRFAGY